MSAIVGSKAAERAAAQLRDAIEEVARLNRLLVAVRVIVDDEDEVVHVDAAKHVAVARARRVIEIAERSVKDDNDELDVVALAAMIIDAVDGSGY